MHVGRVSGEISVDTVSDGLARAPARHARNVVELRAAALLRHRLFGTPSALLRIGRYQLVRMLGQGGMGAVYEAREAESPARIALKVLHEHDAGAALVKREFRGFSALHHPNLVALYELASDREQAFFTMELVEGDDFVSHVRRGVTSGSAPDPRRARAALAQLCTGVLFLHRAGKLHRDLKPSNILVTPEGRVVLLDFGVATDATRTTGQPCAAIAGTPAYMAPEQAAGVATAASDWFGVGMLLHEALTGRLPQPSELQETSLALTGVAPDLAQLCRRLLRQAPEERPRDAAIEAVLAELRGSRDQTLLSARSRRHGGSFVGREQPLQRLHEAFAHSQQGPVLALLSGDAGIGKTSLVERALDEFAAIGGATFLCGRCYERESVPYQGLDEVAEQLARQLSLLSADELTSLLPRERVALARVFPVLAAICGIDAAPRPELSAGNQLALRARAYSAFAELLANLARRTRLVMWIDDAQWGDADGGHLLATLLRSPVPLLLIVCQRSGLDTETGMVQQLHSAATPAVVRRVEVELAPLSQRDGTRLAQSLLPASGPQQKVAAAIALEAAGHPLFIAELAHSALAQGVRDRRRAGSMRALVRSRLRSLSRQERWLVQLVAVAGRPTERAVIRRAAEDDDADATLRGLYLGRFMHSAGMAARDVVQIEHDRVRDLILASLEPGQKRRLHAALARALTAEPRADPETLVDHLIAAGLRAEAPAHALRAADAASLRLAFDRAARLYALALEAPMADRKAVDEIKRKRARALAFSGRGEAAAALYLELATDATEGSARAALRCHAAEHLMFNGRAEEAERALRLASEALGLRWPEQRGLWLQGLVLVQFVLALFWPARGAAREQNIDVLIWIARALAQSDVLRASYFAARGMRACSAVAATHDAAARAQWSSMRGAVHSAATSPRGASAQPFLEEAARLTQGEGDSLSQARAENLAALGYVQLGHFTQARALAQRAEQRLRSVPSTLFDFFDSLHVTGLILLALGELRELEARWSAFVPDVLVRGSPLASVCIRGHGVRVGWLLAAGELDEVRDVIGEQRRMLERFPRLGAVMITLACSEIELALYLGQGAHAQRLLQQHWSTLKLPNVLSSTYLHGLRGRTALLAAGEPTERARRPALLRTARAAARSLQGLARNYAAAPAQLFLANVAHLSGRQELAADHLDRAIHVYDGADMALMALCARRARASLATSDAAKQELATVDAALVARGVKQPARWSETFTPGFAQI